MDCHTFLIRRVGNHHQGVLVLCHQLITRGNGCPRYLILIWAVTRDRWTGYKLITPRCPLAVPIHCIRDQVFDPRLRQVYLLNVIRQLLALCVLHRLTGGINVVD